jgi:hypothetical protein
MDDDDLLFITSPMTEKKNIEKKFIFILTHEEECRLLVVISIWARQHAFSKHGVDLDDEERQQR